MANEDEDLALGIARGIRGVDSTLVNLCMPGLALERMSEKVGLRVAREVYADRTYDDSGNRTSRKQPGAVLHDPEAAATRVLRMVEDRAITTVTGKRVPVEIDTICVHGDELTAVAMARAVRAKLEANDVAIAPFAPA
jgi:5-oxoprolinase (ATP-hydrolysing) subunit A